MASRPSFTALALPLGALALSGLVAGCSLTGGGATAKTTTAAGSTTTTAPADSTTSTAQLESAAVYFIRDGGLVAVPDAATATPAAALTALLAGPPAGDSTAIPAATKLSTVTVTDGIASATFSPELSPPSRLAQAQIVETLGHLPGVTGVSISVDGSGLVALQDGAGNVLSGNATPDAYADLLPSAAIFVAAPVRDSTVSNPVTFSGTADVFEGSFVLEVWSRGTRVSQQPIAASSGTGTRGTFSEKLTLPTGDVKLVVYEPSAADGSPLHETQLYVHVTG